MNDNKYWPVNPFVSLNSSRDRLESWKELRKSLADIDTETAIQRVAEYWSYVPLSSYSYDCDRPETWPTAWEMVSAGEWCRDMRAAAMECTLRLGGVEASPMDIVYLRDYDISEEILILQVGNYALNYREGQVVEYPKTKHVETGRWRFNGRAFESVTS